MRIVSINNYYKWNTGKLPSQRSTQGVQITSVECSAPSFKMLNRGCLGGNSRIRTISDWVGSLKSEHLALGEKIGSFELGVPLSEKIYRKFINTGLDFSEVFAQLRNQIIEKKYEYVMTSTSLVDDEKVNANAYIVEHFKEIFEAIRLLGGATLIWALGTKQQRFEKLIKDTDDYVSFNPKSYIELLMQMTNPAMTEYYQYLDSEKKFIQSQMQGEQNNEFIELHNKNKLILDLLRQQVKESKQARNKSSVKKLYAEISEIRRQEVEAKSDDYKGLEKEMTKIKAEINKLLSDSIKDPQKKIELFYLYKGIPEKEDLVKLNKLVVDKTESGNLIYKKFLLKKLGDLYNLSPYQEQAIEKLKLQESSYFAKLFEAAPRKVTYAYGVEVAASSSQAGFCENLRSLLSTIVADENQFYKTFKELLTISNWENSLQKIFDNLPQNQETKTLFKEKNLNYDVWSTYDEVRDCIRIDDRTVIKKVDMNDIKHSLFLGNQACCCTAVGSGSRSGSAPNYPMNKFIQAIELLIDGVVAGNTMCYLAIIEGKSYPRVTPEGLGEIVVCDNEKTNKLALILDNMEVLKPYCYDEKYLDAFIKYAEKLIQDIGGKSDMAIYAGHRNKFAMMDNFKKESIVRMEVLGSSGEHTLSIDSIANMPVNNGSVSFDKYYYGNFYCIKP